MSKKPLFLSYMNMDDVVTDVVQIIGDKNSRPNSSEKKKKREEGNGL